MRLPSCYQPTLVFSKRLLLPTLLGLCGLAASAQAGGLDFKTPSKNVVPTVSPTEPRFYVSVGGGSDLDYYATKFISNGGGTLFGAPARVDARYFPKTHDALARGEAEVGYRILPAGLGPFPAVTLFARFEYQHANTSLEPIGYADDVFGTFAPGATVRRTIYTDLDDYNAYGGKLGVRVKLPFNFFLKPYASVAVGGKYVEKTNAHVYLGETGGLGTLTDDLGTVRLYKDSAVFSAEFRLGTEFTVARNFSLGIEGGIAYDTKLSRDNRDLGAIGLTGVNKGGDRLYSPVVAYGRFSF